MFSIGVVKPVRLAPGFPFFGGSEGKGTQVLNGRKEANPFWGFPPLQGNHAQMFGQRKFRRNFCAQIRRGEHAWLGNRKRKQVQTRVTLCAFFRGFASMSATSVSMPCVARARRGWGARPIGAAARRSCEVSIAWQAQRFRKAKTGR